MILGIGKALIGGDLLGDAALPSLHPLSAFSGLRHQVMRPLSDLLI